MGILFIKLYSVIATLTFYCFVLQAQQLFQKDAQTITPEALESVKAALASSDIEHKAETKKKAVPRRAAGQSWEDPTLAEWPESMFFFLLLGYTLNLLVSCLHTTKL